MLLSQQTIQHEPEHCLQWAHSFRALDRAQAVMAHQLPWVLGCIPGPAEVLAVDPGQACVSPDAQHNSGNVYKLVVWNLLMLHDSTHPPSLESIWQSTDRSVCIPGILRLSPLWGDVFCFVFSREFDKFGFPVSNIYLSLGRGSLCQPSLWL